jgi:signal transduction histidine kinase
MEFENDIPIRLPEGQIKEVHLRLQVEPGYYDSLSRVLVSWIDMTDRINYEKVLKQSSQELRQLTQHMEEVRENERTEISRDLHDDLGQKLTALNMDISWLKSRIGVQSRGVENKLKEMVHILNDTIESVRKISYGLRPSILDDLGLYSAIEWQLTEFKKSSGINYSLSFIPRDLEIDKKISLTVFRILQESLTNIARHSKATRVQVNIKSGKAAIKVIVRDNGIGISKEKISNHKSFGLVGMKERARTYGGKVIIRSNESEGTTIILEIPLCPSKE